MLFDFIKIKKILNNPNVSYFDDLIYLGDENVSDALVCNRNLALEILKNKNFITYSHEERLQVAHKLIKNLKSTYEHFSQQPLLIDGMPHIESRKKIIKIYELIYQNIDTWINSFTESFFNNINPVSLDPILLVDDYINLVYRNIIATNLKVPLRDVPITPTGIIGNLIINKKFLNKFEDTIMELNEFIEFKLSELNRPKDEVWMLVSIPVQGYETMLGSLVYGLLNDPPNNLYWEANELMRRASGVSLITRKCTEDVQLFEHFFYKNQFIHISPFAVNFNSHFEPDKTIEFGYGKKLCPGKKLSLRIAQEFLYCFYKNKNLKLSIKNEGIIFERLSVLTPKRS